MTPERLGLLQELIGNARKDWTYGDVIYLREPVEFVPRWPKSSMVIDFPVVKKIAFTLQKDRIAIFDRCGYPLTPSFMIVWVEAEGHVIEAYAFDEEGDQVAADMIGHPCPKYRQKR